MSPSQRQSAEIFRKVHDAYVALERPIPAVYESQLRLELANGARVLCLPGREETIRSFGGVTLLVLDEAARIPDDLYRSVRPMLAVSRGRLVALSTPFGQRGWFYDEWQGDGPWKRVQVTWRDCPRITADFIAEETRAMGAAWVAQEYECSFTSREGLVYPDFADAVVRRMARRAGRGAAWAASTSAGATRSRRCAACWTATTCCGSTGSATCARRRCTNTRRRCGNARASFGTPTRPARTEIEELRASGLTVRRADNDIRLGIAAVTARLRTGRLKVHGPACPQSAGRGPAVPLSDGERTRCRSTKTRWTNTITPLALCDI